MQVRQKPLIESYQRAQAFLQAHPAPAPASYGGPQESLCAKLRERHLRPIVAIAKAEMADLLGIEKALRLPAATLRVTKLVAEAAAIREAAELYQPAFVKNGRPADFLDQLTAAIEVVKQSTLGRARRTSVGRWVPRPESRRKFGVGAMPWRCWTR